SAIDSSSRSIELSPSLPPSVVATRFATGMNAEVAGIFSSARFRLAMSGALLLQVGRPLHLPRRSRLELFTLPLRRRNAVLDRLADRVVGVGDHLPRPLRRVACALDGVTAAAFGWFATLVVELLIVLACVGVVTDTTVA